MPTFGALSATRVERQAPGQRLHVAGPLAPPLQRGCPPSRTLRGLARRPSAERTSSKSGSNVHTTRLHKQQNNTRVLWLTRVFVMLLCLAEPGVQGMKLLSHGSSNK